MLEIMNKGGSCWKDDVLLRYFQLPLEMYTIWPGVSEYSFSLLCIWWLFHLTTPLSIESTVSLATTLNTSPQTWLWKSRIVAGMSQSPPSKRQRTSSTTTTTSFPIEPISQFAGTSAIIKQPVELTCFSYDKHRNLHHDTSSMVLPPSSTIYWRL